MTTPYLPIVIIEEAQINNVLCHALYTVKYIQTYLGKYVPSYLAQLLVQ